MKRIFLLMAIILFGVISCKKKEDEKPDPIKIKNGDLNVRVMLNGNQYVEQAAVYTNPVSKQGTTDKFGSVLLTDIAIGSYEVFADLKNIGIGKSVVNIRENELSEISVDIYSEIVVGNAPLITIVLPSQPAEFREGEPITFSADVADDETPLQEIKILWESNLDGVLNDSPPNLNGNTSFSTSSLSRGVHQITLTAENLEEYSASKTIQVSTLAPSSVTLLEPVKEQGKVILAWTEYPDSDFLKYEVYRTDGNCTEENKALLSTISDKGITGYTDELPPFEYQVCYFIRAYNIDNNARNSNHEAVESPSGHVFNFNAYDMLKHPTEAYIYLLDQGGQKLIKFDYINSEVVNEVYLQSKIGYCAIGDNGFGVEIYAPGTDGKIYVYNADDLSRTATITTGLPTTSVVINGLGHVIAAVVPSPWWEKPVRTYMRSNGINIDGNGHHDGDRLRMIPGKNEIISISTSVSPVDMEYFKLSDEGYIDLHQNDPYHGDYWLNPKIFRISDNGTYSITSKYGAVYLANSSMEYKGRLQSGTLLFSDFAFSEDGAIIYAATSNRKSIQIGHYPSLIRDDEILTRGFPLFILRDGNRLISLGKSTEESINTGIEVIDL